MSNLELALWSFPILIGLVFLRVPIGLAMMMVGGLGTVVVTGSWTPILAQLKSLTYSTFANYALSIVPLFLLMGQFAAKGGLSTALFQAAAAVVGHRRGGVAMAAVGACGGFAAVCGSSLATAATMGQVALEELRRYGYSGALATGTLAAGGTLGVLIPPSVVLVIYAVLAEQNIAKLFIAALVPGALALLGYLVTVWLYVRFSPQSVAARPKASRRERRLALLAIWPIALIFGLVVGGIYGGWFTPTEAAAVGAIGTGLVALARGGLGGGQLVEIFKGTATATGMIYFIILGAAVFNGFLAFTQLPQEAARFVTESGLSPWLVLGLILLTYLVFGCVMDSLSMILLTIPIFLPIVSSLDLGLSPEELALWFGILVLIVVEVGLITPPVGINLFVVNALAPDVPIGRTYLGVLPFVVSDLVRIAAILAVPALALALPRLLFP